MRDESPDALLAYMLKHHKALGDPCLICGNARDAHRRAPKERSRAYVERKREKKASTVKPTLYLGIDGEGQGRYDHRYVLLAASDSSGTRRWYIENFRGLSTIECLEFLLRLPQQRCKTFAYSFNYDLTKILVDLPDNVIHDLFHPEVRQSKDASRGPLSIYWEGYRLNLQGTQFTVESRGRSRVVWDIFKYYQKKFVGALADWKVGDPEVVKRMIFMKDHRADFDKLNHADVRQYCFEECQYMASLAVKLIKATDDAGLPQTTFHGAGSIASALLKKIGIKEQLKTPPPEMNYALACGFAGGRFEHSVIGVLEDPLIISKDISSAYPYHITFLPCLIHGRWEYTKERKDIERADTKAALVHYGLGPSTAEDWGPFPFRALDGSICFPVESGGGWVWRDEYLMGERYFPNVEFRGAWVLRGDCDCQPFKTIPDYYRERMRIGKEGPGIIIKLGYNAVYGKIAQSVGNARFNNWAWAGMITSGCRAQVLHMMGLHKDRSNLLIVATDGIYTREDFDSPVPRDTNTWSLDAPCEKAKHGPDVKGCKCKGDPSRRYTETNKPLGGWERKEVRDGMCIVRPGIYFPINPKAEDLETIRGRGVGKGVILENWGRIRDALKSGVGTPENPTVVKVANVTRFCGAKTSISRSGKPDAWRYHRADGLNDTRHEELGKARRWLMHAREAETFERFEECITQARRARHIARNQPDYGQWVTREVELNFNPLPKRNGVHEDGVRLKVRRIPRHIESAPYDRVRKSQEARDLLAFAQEMLEQPDPDLHGWDEIDASGM